MNLLTRSLIPAAEEADAKLLPVVPGSLRPPCRLVHGQLDITWSDSVRGSARGLSMVGSNPIHLLLLVVEPSLVLVHEEKILLQLKLVFLHQVRSFSRCLLHPVVVTCGHVLIQVDPQQWFLWLLVIHTAVGLQVSLSSDLSAHSAGLERQLGPRAR